MLPCRRQAYFARCVNRVEVSLGTQAVSTSAQGTAHVIGTQQFTPVLRLTTKGSKALSSLTLSATHLLPTHVMCALCPFGSSS